MFRNVLCRLYKLSLRNVAQMFFLRGFEFTHEVVQEWKELFAPLLTNPDPLETERRSAGASAGELPVLLTIKLQPLSYGTTTRVRE